MKSEWTKYCLGDLYEAHNGLSKGGKFFGSGYPFLSFSTVFNNWFIPDELTDLVQSTEKEQEAYSICRGDIFVTRTSETIDELGMSSVALKDYPNATYNGFTKRLRPTTDKVLPEFIGYYFRCPFFRNAFKSFSNMTTRASLKNEDLLSMEILLPPIDEQYKIASILRNIDMIIERNNLSNQYLMLQARALYKSWFVDFDPFNDEEVNHWEKGMLKDLLTLKRNSIKAGENTELPYLPIDAIPMNTFAISSFKPNEEAKSSLIRFDKDDILIGAMRVYFHRVVIAPCDGITRTTCFTLCPNDSNYLSYCLLLCDLDNSIEYAQLTSKGSTMPYAIWDNGLGDMEIIIPPQTIAKEFNDLAMPMIRIIQNSYFENAKLTELRNTLLPKLISGELDVSEVNI